MSFNAAVPIPQPPQPDENNVTVPAPAIYDPSTRDEINMLPAVRSSQRDLAIEQYERAMTQAQAEVREVIRVALQTTLPPIIQRVLRAEATADLRKILNRRCGGTHLSVVPFQSGLLPTEDPHNLPLLDSVNAVDNLCDEDVVSYLNGYGVELLPDVPGDPGVTDRERKTSLKYAIGAIKLSTTNPLLGPLVW